jgi:hypothetical protein
MTAFRLTLSIIAAMLVGLLLYAREHGKVKRFARAWAEQAIEPRIYLIKWD